MKKQFLSAKTLMLAALILVVSGCVITINHKFEDRYYARQGVVSPTPGPDTVSSTTPAQPPKNLIENMVEVAHLGTGYDLVYTDPEDLAANSVQNSDKVKPAVFVFGPDPDRYIDMKLLDREYRRNLPKGVSGNPLAGFRWSSSSKWIRTATEYQNSFGFGISGGGGLADVAAFTGSVRFKNMQTNTRNSEHFYLNQDGYYEGHVLAMDKNFIHQLHPDFRAAVENLPTNDPAAYDRFIKNWGTHYSSQAKFGAKCSYRFTFTKEAYTNSFENENSFGVKAEGGAKAVKFEFGTEVDFGTKSKIQDDSGAQEIEFISHGGSGERDFGEWSKHASANRIPIEVTFSAYTELLIPAYYPEIPPTELEQKRKMLDDAYTRYFKKHEYVQNNDFSDFFDSKEVRFKGTILQMEYTTVSFNEKEGPLVNKNNEIYGIVSLGAYDSNTGAKLVGEAMLFDLDKGHYLKAEEGTILAFSKGVNGIFINGGEFIVRDKDGNIIPRSNTLEFVVPRDKLKTCYLSLLAELYEYEIGYFNADAGSTKFPEKNQLSTDNRIPLSEAADEPKPILLISPDGDVMTFRVKLERVQ